MNSINRHISCMLTFLISILVFPFLTAGSLAQAADQGNIQVSGTVTSATDGAALPGLSVVIQGTSLGTVTNSEGRYSLNVPDNAVLIFSFVGFATQEIPVQGRNLINVEMEESIESLDEVVVTALGIRREEKITWIFCRESLW
jgi:hypothetical protein